jgi:serine/threonine protein kinase
MEKESVEIFEQIIKGVRVLTEHSLIHRDLKPENILIKNGVYKISDFGLTKKADLTCQQKLIDICGTPIYMAPELLFKKPYTAKCDIWSLGLILYEMIYGSTPWPIKCINNYKNALKKYPLSFPFDVRIGKETKDFLKRSLVVDDSKRMDWKELYEHPFIKSKLTGEAAMPTPMNFKVRSLLSKVQR